MPNIFTPNNDGLNDFFIPIEISGIEQAVLSIFSRWGKKIFETTNIYTGWNGKINDTYCADGVYFWNVKFRTMENEEKILNGHLNLIK